MPAARKKLGRKGEYSLVFSFPSRACLETPASHAIVHEHAFTDGKPWPLIYGLLAKLVRSQDHWILARFFCFFLDRANHDYNTMSINLTGPDASYH